MPLVTQITLGLLRDTELDLCSLREVKLVWSGKFIADTHNVGLHNAQISVSSVLVFFGNSRLKIAWASLVLIRYAEDEDAVENAGASVP